MASNDELIEITENKKGLLYKNILLYGPRITEKPYKGRVKSVIILEGIMWKN